MLLEMAVADAYGIAFEFCKPSSARPNTLDRYYQHPKYANLKPGQYTDDTQRAIANVRVMSQGRQFDAKVYAAEYVRALRDDPRDGYSRGYQKFLEETKDASEFIRNIKRTKATNGALMGVAPLGYLETPGEVMMAASVQAIATHSVETVPYACGVALAAHYFIHKLGKKRGLLPFLSKCLNWESGDFPMDDYIDIYQPTEMRAEYTFHSVLLGLHNFKSLSDIIKWAVDCGGDTDSLAAVTVAIASCSDEFKNDIPQALIDGLENGAYGRDYLRRTDALLLSWVPL